MTERVVGIRVIATSLSPALGVAPVVPFPATEAERRFAAEEASKAALLLNKPTPGQAELFRCLAENSSGGGYIVRESRWIATILKATQDFNVETLRRLHTFDWCERPISSDGLLGELKAFLREATPTSRE